MVRHCVERRRSLSITENYTRGSYEPLSSSRGDVHIHPYISCSVSIYTGDRSTELRKRLTLHRPTSMYSDRGITPEEPVTPEEITFAVFQSPRTLATFRSQRQTNTRPLGHLHSKVISQTTSGHAVEAGTRAGNTQGSVLQKPHP